MGRAEGVRCGLLAFLGPELLALDGREHIGGGLELGSFFELLDLLVVFHL